MLTLQKKDSIFADKMIAYEEFEVSTKDDQIEGGKMGEINVAIWNTQKVVIKRVNKDGDLYKHFAYEVSCMNDLLLFFFVLGFMLTIIPISVFTP